MSKEQNSHIFIEEMNGFLPIVESLDQTESHHFEYGNQEDFLDLLQHGQQIVGLVKGPRSKITPQMERKYFISKPDLAKFLCYRLVDHRFQVLLLHLFFL